MSLTEKIKKHFTKNGLPYLLGFSILGVSSYTIGIVQDCIERGRLDKSNFILKVEDDKSIAAHNTYYSYDDNLDGSIDRIELAAIASRSFGKSPAIPIRRTIKIGEPEFDFYLNRVEYLREISDNE